MTSLQLLRKLPAVWRSCFESSTLYKMKTIRILHQVLQSLVSPWCDGDSFSRRLPAVHMSSRKERVLRRERTEKLRSEKLWDMVWSLEGLRCYGSHRPQATQNGQEPLAAQATVAAIDLDQSEAGLTSKESRCFEAGALQVAQAVQTVAGGIANGCGTQTSNGLACMHVILKGEWETL